MRGVKQSAPGVVMRMSNLQNDIGSHIQRTISSPLYGYHCTTLAKVERYKASGRITAPVRFWPDISTARRWCKRTGRSVILKIRLEDISYPLPDHKPALWCPADVLDFEGC